MFEFITDILWLAAALAVFASIVLFILNPAYAFWVENKYHMDLESELYETISEAVEEAVQAGKTIQVQLHIGETDAKDKEAPSK